MEGRAFLRGPPCPSLEGADLLLHEFLERTLTKNPELGERDALFASDGETLTFDELNRRANQLAARLVASIPSNSPEVDRIVIVCMLPGIDLIVSLLAVFKAGAAYLPVDPSFPADRVAYIIEDSQAVLFLTADSVLRTTGFASVPEAKVPVFDVESFKWDNQEVAHPGNRVPREDGKNLAVVLYTSGSTGTPKGVRLDHRTILHRLNWQWHAFPFGEDEASCFKTALTFVDSISEIWAPLLIGRPVQIVPKHVTRDTQRFIDLLSRCKISRLVLVPSLLKAIITFLKAQSQHDAYLPLKHLKMWICSGEVLTKELMLEFYDCFPPGTVLADYYGSTEVMGDVTFSAFESRDHALSALVENKVPIGIPVDDVAIYLLDEKKELVGPGEIGEIYVAGAHMCSGYIRNREMDRFSNNHIDDTPGYEIMYRTGDYGRIVNNMVYYEGRADSQIKIRGHRVDLNEVNGIVYRLNDLVAACVVLCYKPGEPDQEMVAFIVPKRQGTNNTIDLVKDRLKEKLISYMMPKLIEIEEMPLLVNGKVDRQKLLRLFAGQRKLQKDAAKCEMLFNESELGREELALLKTVVSVVGATSAEHGKPVQLSDNFFEIGGNSLNAVNVVTKLKDQGFNLDLTAFLGALQLQDLIPQLKMTKPDRNESDHTLSYIMEMLKDDVKEDVIRIISTSFSKKAELELLTGVIYEDYDIFMRQLWEPLVAANLSFVLKDEIGRVLAVALNFDVFDEPTVEPHVKRLAYVFEFLEDVEAPVREKHFEKRVNFAIHGFMMATDASCSAAENVLLIRRMEHETLELAKKRGFSAVFTTNTNELTRQVCDDLLDYEILSECQVNRYVANDGTRPFADAPDSQYSTATVKYIR